MAWNHRVFKEVLKDGTFIISIREVFYNDKNEIYAHTDEPINLSGETEKGLKQYIEWCLKAFDSPMLEVGKIDFADDQIDEEEFQELNSKELDSIDEMFEKFHLDEEC